MQEMALTVMFGGVTLRVKLVFVFSATFGTKAYEAGLWQENYLNSLRNFYLGERLTFYHF